MFRFGVAAVAALAIAVPTQAAALKIGEAAPKFSNLESATSGKKFSLDDFKDKDVLVVAFTCNHCPHAVAYEDRFVQFANEHANKSSKVGFIAISVNNKPASDKFDKMQERAKAKGFTFEYLCDPSQKIAVDMGASARLRFLCSTKIESSCTTAHFDDSEVATKVAKQYTVDAVKATLKGEKPAVQTSAFDGGCTIKFDKK